MRRKAKINLHFMRANRELSKHIPLMQELAAPAVREIRGLLPFKQSVDVIVHHEFYERCGLTVSGVASTANVAYIHLDPSQQNFRKEIRQQFVSVLAHELHHTCREQGPGCGDTLLEMLVSEGLACHFEEEFTGIKSSVIPKRFGEEKLKRLYRRVQKELYSKKYNHDAWFFGDKKLRIPAQGGYVLGYDLTAYAVEKYSAAELVHWSAKDIIDCQ